MVQTVVFSVECAVLCEVNFSPETNPREKIKLKMNKIQKIKKLKKENNNLILKKVESQLDLILERQEINQNEFRRGFIGLATQN